MDRIGGMVILRIYSQDGYPGDRIVKMVIPGIIWSGWSFLGLYGQDGCPGDRKVRVVVLGICRQDGHLGDL